MTAKPAALAVLTWTGVTARRMARHALTEPATDLGAGRGSRPALRSACPGAQCRRTVDRAAHRWWVRTDVRRALWEKRSLVKTFGPRGTIHLLPTADLPMWTGALSALPSSVPTHPEGVRFTPGQADEVIAAIGAALADTELTVDELTEAIADCTGLWAVERKMEVFQSRWPRWRQITSTAAHRGMLCFGTDRGRKVTYTNPHRWVPGFQPTGSDTALRTLVTRYLHAYGPASPQHFARWLNIPPRYAAELFGTLASELEYVELDGRSWRATYAVHRVRDAHEAVSHQPSATGNCRGPRPATPPRKVISSSGPARIPTAAVTIFSGNRAR